MLDTNICIYIIKNRPASVLQKLQQIDPSDVCISSVTYAELMHGAEKSAFVERNKLAISLLLVNIAILDFGVDAANAYGKVRAVLEKQGTPIGPLDNMIAGHAISLGCTLITNNVKEFSRVDGLVIENWAE
ncbi:MAG: type II toxin-antitoxin system VapC family toxin [Dehalococcoidales bacterium]|nr:type II toxin-antitoxin system VapC family toxin [Dehalococcoidales bacterium]